MEIERDHPGRQDKYKKPQYTTFISHTFQNYRIGRVHGVAGIEITEAKV